MFILLVSVLGLRSRYLSLNCCWYSSWFENYQYRLMGCRLFGLFGVLLSLPEESVMVALEVLVKLL
jgi:hypothetical protein